MEMEMIFVKGGTFLMGSPDSDPDACVDEKPQHQVTVGDFLIGKYPVTQRQWMEIMGSNPSYFKNCEDCPVENVSWNDVQEFLKKLNAKNPGKNYRLPTEAEWEYAARGGQLSRGYRYAGSDDPDKVAWYWNNSGNKTHPVGDKAPNEIDLYDMSGNVWEWCEDWYHDSYDSAPLDGSAWTSGGDSGRVLRGGSWNCLTWFVRVALRDYLVPSSCSYDLGFRLAQ